MEIKNEDVVIQEYIDFLEARGYKVCKNNVSMLGKWVAYRRKGMEPIQHGKIVREYEDTYELIKKRNKKNWTCRDDVIKFCDTKQECYSIK